MLNALKMIICWSCLQFFITLWHMMRFYKLFCSLPLHSFNHLYHNLFNGIIYSSIFWGTTISKVKHYKMSLAQKAGVGLQCLHYLWRRSLTHGPNRVVGSEVGWPYPKPFSVAGMHGCGRLLKTGSTNGVMMVWLEPWRLLQIKFPWMFLMVTPLTRSGPEGAPLNITMILVIFFFFYSFLF